MSKAKMGQRARCPRRGQRPAERFRRRRNGAEWRQAPGCERGATFERSENGVASTLPPAGATTGQRGFAQRNGAERRQAPGCERGASRGTKERTPADPAGICGATFEQSENGGASTLPPAGATTGRAVSPQAKCDRMGASAGVLAGGPRLSKAKAGQAKTSAPVGPMTARAVSPQAKRRRKPTSAGVRARGQPWNKGTYPGRPRGNMRGHIRAKRKWGSEHVAPSGGNDRPARFRRRRNATEREQGPGFCRWGPGAAQP